MNCAHSRQGIGNRGLSISRRVFRRGFTLLEMCMVLFIIAILFGVTMPAMQSAFVEQAVRKDTHQLALMVKTAMIQSAEQHREYVIDLSDTTMALHPANEAAKDAPAADASPGGDDDAPASATSDVSVTDRLDAPNKLLAPDPRKSNAWVDMPDTEWTFEPGELCPATRVRMARGDAWIEISFNALTGNVENETAYLP